MQDGVSQVVIGESYTKITYELHGSRISFPPGLSMTSIDQWKYFFSSTAPTVFLYTLRLDPTLL